MANLQANKSLVRGSRNWDQQCKPHCQRILESASLNDRFRSEQLFHTPPAVETLARIFLSLVGRSCCFALIQGGSRFGIGTPYRTGCGMFSRDMKYPD